MPNDTPNPAFSLFVPQGQEPPEWSQPLGAFVARDPNAQPESIHTVINDARETAEVPLSKLADSLKNGWHYAVSMVEPKDGKTGWVPSHNVKTALQAGFKYAPVKAKK